MSRRIDMINGFPVMVDDEIGGYNSTTAIPISFIAHNERIIQQAEQALSQLACIDDTRVFIKNPDGTTIRIQPGCKIMYVQSIGNRRDNHD